MVASNNTKNILFVAARENKVQSFILPLLSSFFDMHSVVRND